MSDHLLESEIMQALARHHGVHADQMAVEAIDGEVILRGTAGGLLERAEAMRTARAVPGVRRVDDQLQVRPLGIDARVDADTKAAVLAELIADDRLHAADIDVDVDDGVVTLSGLVELVAMRDEAERVAREVGGVRHVRNRLKVWLTVSADDVAERITDAIGADAVVGIDQIDVQVRDNDVTLRGWVTSAEHHTAALEAAAHAPGVAKVRDELSLRSRG
jgi:osmotically-inducible protein OsmY